MSIEELRRETDAATMTPYLVTVRDDGRPHCVSVSVTWTGDHITVGVGNKTFTNAVTRPLVTLVWPPSTPGGHSLIVDATAATADGPEGQLQLSPTGAVLHRTVTIPGASTGDPDCRPVSRR